MNIIISKFQIIVPPSNSTSTLARRRTSGVCCLRTCTLVLSMVFVFSVLFACELDATDTEDDSRKDISNFAWNASSTLVSGNKNSTISPITLSWDEKLPVYYTIAPALPDGLKFNYLTQEISGTLPDNEMIATYIITARTSGTQYKGTKNVYINLVVLDTLPDVIKKRASLLDEVNYTVSGTPISTLEELRAIDDLGRDPYASYYLTNNLNIREKNEFGGIAAWEALFSDSEPFKGNLYGNGYAIYNITIAGTIENSNYVGLFASLDGAKIYDLILGVNSISGNKYIGALAGHAKNDTIIRNISLIPQSSSAKVSANESVAGGVVGIVGKVSELEKETEPEVSQITEIRAHNFGVNVESNSSLPFTGTGGLVGVMRGGYVLGSSHGLIGGGVNKKGSKKGGLVGLSGAVVMGYSVADIEGDSQLGGLVGKNIEDGAVIGYATGTVTGNSGYEDAGGLVGYNAGTGGVIGFATGKVGGTTNVGGLIGSASGASIGYWDKTSTGQGTSGGSSVVGISATKNIRYSGGVYKDNTSTIFDNAEFVKYFDVTKGSDKTWPSLRTDIDFGGYVFTIQPSVSDTDSNETIEVAFP